MSSGYRGVIRAQAPVLEPLCVPWYHLELSLIDEILGGTLTTEEARQKVRELKELG